MYPRFICIALMTIAVISFACTGAKAPEPEGNGAATVDNEPKGPSFEELYGALYSEDYKEAGGAMEILKNKPDQYAQDVIEMARKMDPELSDKAIEMIGRMKLEEGRDIIKQALDSDERSLRMAAIKAVGMIGETGVTGKIMEYSHSDDPDIRGNCANVLGGLAEAEGVVERLRELAADDEIKVRMAAYSGLGRAKDTGADRLLYDALFKEAKLKAEGEPLGSMVTGIVAIAMQNAIGPEDCGMLLSGLGPENLIEVRYTLFEAVAQQKCPGAVEPLMKITRDTGEDDMTRVRAGFYLASIGDTRGYKAADDIYFALEQGLLKYDPTKFLDIQTLMGQYRGFLDVMELAMKGG